jgi:hypothetical protein
MPDIRAWASDVTRLLTPGGHLFVHEARTFSLLARRM